MSLTTTLTNPLRSPDWLLGTNRNITLPQRPPAESPTQNIQPTVPSAEEVQLKQSDDQPEVAAAVTIDMHDYPEASTQKEDTEAGRTFTQDSTSSRGSTPDSVGKQSTPPGLDADIAEGLSVLQPKSVRTVQFSVV